MKVMRRRIANDEDYMSDEEIMYAADVAEKEYNQGKLKKYDSVADLIKDLNLESVGLR